MEKTKKETIGELRKELSSIKNLYNSDCVKRKGKTKDTNEYYSELIANELLLNLNVFDKISTVTRTKNYYQKNHGNIEINVRDSTRFEEIFAKRITGLSLEGLGLILDYQIPLKATLANKKLGKIDLISFNEETKTLYLIELKYGENVETLLRASLEIYTYYKIADKTKLINDYLSNQKVIKNKNYNHIEPNDIIVKPAVLVTPKCNAYNELKNIESSERAKLKALALALDISYFSIELLTNETIL